MNKKIENFFQSQIEEHIHVVRRTSKSMEENFVKLVDICLESVKNGNKIIFFGNGGSASDAQHLSTELTVRYSKNRKSISAISLSTDTSALTAIGNDLGFDQIFSRQLEALGKTGDVAIGISTSGKSKNVINGLAYSKRNGIKTVIFTGKNISDIEKFADIIISIPTNITSRIQETHILIGQMLCNALEYKMGLAPLVKEDIN